MARLGVGTVDAAGAIGGRGQSRQRSESSSIAACGRLVGTPVQAWLDTATGGCGRAVLDQAAILALALVERERQAKRRVAGRQPGDRDGDDPAAPYATAARARTTGSGRRLRQR